MQNNETSLEEMTEKWMSVSVTVFLLKEMIQLFLALALFYVEGASEGIWRDNNLWPLVTSSFTVLYCTSVDVSVFCYNIL